MCTLDLFKVLSQKTSFTPILTRLQSSHKEEDWKNQDRGVAVLFFCLHLHLKITTTAATTWTTANTCRTAACLLSSGCSHMVVMTTSQPIAQL
jgi:hypothetical protein